MLLLAPQRAELRVLHISLSAERALIEMTSIGASLLRDAAELWARGAEDFGVSPDRARLARHLYGQLDRESLEVWFWGPSYGGP